MVVMDGEKSFPCDFLSGVPQWIVFGPILFLIFINDIGESLNSNINLFDDDCPLYRNIRSEEDSYILQNDLKMLYDWIKRWEMEFNMSKCYSLTVTLNKNKIRTNYRINKELVENVNSYKYLGVYISSKMQWNETVDHMVSKANSTLGLLKRNFSACSSGTKEKLYLSLVCPKLENSFKVWSPSSMELKQRIEMVQRNDVRFVAGNYNRRSSVTDMLGCINWESLESRRTCLQLKLLHKMFTC